MTDHKPLDAVRLLNSSFPGHVDIPRLREGRLGGAFWTVWAPCPDIAGGDPGPDFTAPTHHVRDALEMVDLIQAMVAQHPDDLQLARTSEDIWAAFRAGRIASLLGMEGTHMLGNSLSVLRIFAQLGVRYLTLTHTCHSAFASATSWRAGNADTLGEVHPGGGLSELGIELVRELNRVGIMIDLSHTSDATMRQAIGVSKAPVVWTHAGARAIRDHPRNVPDDILALIGGGEGQLDGLVQSVFFPDFIGEHPGVNASHVVDHMEHIGSIIGRNRVGIASDFDGMYMTVDGLEDASKYPTLVSRDRVHRRG
jgi:membrane dipeptidase